jgi:hypothetical protein
MFAPTMGKAGAGAVAQAFVPILGEAIVDSDLSP